MKIVAATLQMSSSHFETSRHEVRERLRMWTGERPDFEGAARGNREVVRISDAAKTRHADEAAAAKEVTEAVDNDPMLGLLRAVIEALTGESMRVFDSREMAPKTPLVAELADPNGNGGRPANFGLEYDRHESTSESETTNFAAEGVVRTADGQEIRFSVDLEMSRSHHEESDVSLRLGNARRKDPLVINFDGNATRLSDQKFSIDLDADGSSEEAHFVAAGSGFLVFDRNGDGRINSGREMFGATTGDGFAELAALDGDGNGWLDENDAGFAKLRVWTKAADGSDQLATLKDRGVGTLSLARIATPFDLKDNRNQSLGLIRSSGVYLSESGNAGSIQQIDLSV